jgi:hypothetical protein
MYSAVSRVEPLPLSPLPRSVCQQNGGGTERGLYLHTQTGRQAEKKGSLEDRGESVGVEVFYTSMEGYVLVQRNRAWGQVGEECLV